jgi:hypothetical protein
MDMGTDWRGQAGISLVEALIASMLTAFILLALGAYQSSTLRASGQVKTRAEALRLAEAKLEDLRSYTDASGFDGISTGSETVPAMGSGSNASFTRAWDVTPYTNANPPLTEEIWKVATVTVQWTDPEGQPQIIELESTLGKSIPGESIEAIVAGIGAGSGTGGSGGGTDGDTWADTWGDTGDATGDGTGDDAGDDTGDETSDDTGDDAGADTGGDLAQTGQCTCVRSGNKGIADGDQDPACTDNCCDEQMSPSVEKKEQFIAQCPVA